MSKAIAVLAWFCASGAYFLAADSSADTPPADRPTPQFVVKPLPKEYRAAHEPALHPNYCSLGMTAIVAGRERLVAVLSRPSPNYDGPWVPFMHRAPPEYPGWLAIDLPQGELTCLMLDNQKPQGGVRVVAGRELYRWSVSTCALEVRYIPIASKQEWTGEFPGEESEFWEWDPATPTPKRLGRLVPVAGLANALIGTDYKVEWSDEAAEPWSGAVRLTHRKTGKSRPFIMRHLVPPPETEPVQVMYGQQFGPTEDRDSFIGAEYARNMHTTRRADFALWREHLESGRTQWRLDHNALQKAVGGGTVLEMQLVPGPVRPCRQLPILIRQDRMGSDAMRILWQLDTKTGSLRGPYPLSCQFCLMGHDALNRPNVCATPDGRLVAHYEGASGATDPFRVFDLAKESLIAKPALRHLYPGGFISRQQLVLLTALRVECLAPPYSGKPELVFRLDEGQKKLEE